MTDIDDVLSEQREYYRARAAEYDDWWNRSRSAFRSVRHSAAWRREVDQAKAWLDGAGLRGDVLELAGGTGNWTVELEQHARSLTVVDSSPETLAISRTKLVAPEHVEFVVSDVFDYEPRRRFDVVFFSFWLSHVPRELFDRFWHLVDRCLAPGGRVALIDSAHPSVMSGAPDSGLESTSVPTVYVGSQGAISLGDGVAERRLDDGSRHRIVKRFWMPDELESDVAGLGWRARARNTDHFFLLAELERAA